MQLTANLTDEDGFPFEFSSFQKLFHMMSRPVSPGHFRLWPAHQGSTARFLCCTNRNELKLIFCSFLSTWKHAQTFIQSYVRHISLGQNSEVFRYPSILQNMPAAFLIMATFSMKGHDKTSVLLRNACKQSFPQQPELRDAPSQYSQTVIRQR